MTQAEDFQHSTPELYDRYMVPLLFEPYARLVAERSAALNPARILETAAGTGVLTRVVHDAVPRAQIVATDINPAMLALLGEHVRSERVTIEPADAMNLSYADESFDLVLCQFGVMFFPDKVRANVEASRLLRSGGQYILVTFDQLERNPVPKAAEEAVATLFPDDPPNYMERGPFSYTDPTVIEKDLRTAGFTEVAVETVALSSRLSARDAAYGMVLGSPFRAEIERRDSSALAQATDVVTKALLQWDGMDMPMSAHVVTASR